jgi:hypothetical protein
MNLLIPTKTSKPSTILIRAAWAAAAVVLIAFALFEMTKHPGWAIGLGVTGAIAPDLTMLIGLRDQTEPRQFSRRAVPYYNIAHLWALPILVLLWFSIVPATNDDAAPGFTLGLTWLAHICLDRVFGFGPRNRDGWLRYRLPDND